MESESLAIIVVVTERTLRRLSLDMLTRRYYVRVGNRYSL